MNDRRIAFVADDPGGYDVIMPVFQKFCQLNGYKPYLFLLGASKSRNEKYAYDNDIFINKFTELVMQKKILILVTGTSWGKKYELEAIKISRQNGIPTISILDYWANYSSRFLMRDKHIYPDFLFVMDKYAEIEGVKDGIPKSIIRIVGHPGLDRFSIKREYSQADRAIFVSQPLKNIYGERLGYNEYTTFPLAQEVCDNLKIRLDVKFHPNESRDFKKEYESQSVNGELDDLVTNYRFMIGMNSMALLQYAISGMPVISFEPGLKGKDICITNLLGITKVALNRDELTERIRKINTTEIKLKSWIWNDGKSTERCVKEIEKIIDDTRVV